VRRLARWGENKGEKSDSQDDYFLNERRRFSAKKPAALSGGSRGKRLLQSGAGGRWRAEYVVW